MSNRLNDEITSEFRDTQEKWGNSHNQTRDKLVNLKKYYSDTEGKSKDEVLCKAKEDRASLEKNIQEYKEIAATAKNCTRDLKTQVGSSEDGVAKMKKYGRPAAFVFTLLGALIGLGLGLKVPGLGQVVAVVVAVVIGIVCFGFFAFMVYIFMSRRAQKRERSWKRAEHDNQQGLGLEAIVVPKRTRLNDISDKLNDIEEDNFNSGREGLCDAITGYLDDN